MSSSKSEQKQIKRLEDGVHEIIYICKKAKKLCRKWNKTKGELSNKDRAYFDELLKYELVKFKMVFGKDLAIVAKSIPLPFPSHLYKK